MGKQDRNVPDSEDWDDLVSAIESKRCVVMLGDHAVTARYDAESLPEPLPDALDKFLRRRLEREGVTPPTQGDGGPQASTLAQEAIKADGVEREGLERWMEIFYDRQSGYADPTLEALSELPLGIVVNTIPGLPLESILRRRHPNLAVGAYDRNGDATGLVESWDGDGPLVYNLYGSFEQPGSLALTDSDLLDVLVSVVSGDPALPANLLSALRDPHRTYLFLGFRLFRWQQRVLMRVLDEAAARPRRTSRSFAFEAENDVVFDGTRNFFTRGHKINFFTDMTPAGFVTELRRRIAGDTGTPSSTPASRSGEVYPEKIFICHASEDREDALAIAEHLETNGLRPWIDRADLQGGDEWNDKIENTLDKIVRYVVVVRSENLSRKRRTESYVNQEIDIAMRRRRRFGTSGENPPKFLIPIHIDADRTADKDLDEIQAIDYAAEGGPDQLVSAIRRDIQEDVAHR